MFISRALRLLTVMALAGVTLAVVAQEQKFNPVDEAAQDLDWQRYKARLLEALAERNRASVLAAIDPNVDNGPDQKPGIAEFRRRWDFERDDSPLWSELSKAISLGGGFVMTPAHGRRFCTPYVAARWPTNLDPFRHGAIVTREVLVKSEPSSGSETIGHLNHDVVRVEDWEVADKTPGFPQKWTKVRLAKGSGFVPEEQIRSPIEHMACFAGGGNQWRLVSFTAGYLPE